VAGVFGRATFRIRVRVKCLHVAATIGILWVLLFTFRGLLNKMGNAVADRLLLLIRLFFITTVQQFQLHLSSPSLPDITSHLAIDSPMDYILHITYLRWFSNDLLFCSVNYKRCFLHWLCFLFFVELVLEDMSDICHFCLCCCCREFWTARSYSGTSFCFHFCNEAVELLKVIEELLVHVCIMCVCCLIVST
jgi:hypothetical protein